MTLNNVHLNRSDNCLSYVLKRVLGKSELKDSQTLVEILISDCESKSNLGWRKLKKTDIVFWYKKHKITSPRFISADGKILSSHIHKNYHFAVAEDENTLSDLYRENDVNGIRNITIDDIKETRKDWNVAVYRLADFHAWAEAAAQKEERKFEETDIFI